MEFIILDNIQNNLFIKTDASSERMEAIGQFLTLDVACFVKFFKKELNASSVKFAANACHIEKLGDQIVLTDDFNETWTITLPTIKLIKLLDKWAILISLPVWPEKVKITMDDDYNFEMKYELNGVERVI